MCTFRENITLRQVYVLVRCNSAEDLGVNYALSTMIGMMILSFLPDPISITAMVKAVPWNMI